MEIFIKNQITTVWKVDKRDAAYCSKAAITTRTHVLGHFPDEAAPILCVLSDLT